MLKIQIFQNHNVIASMLRIRMPGMFISMEEEIWRKLYVRAKVAKICMKLVIITIIEGA
jgi:hypothetical protein